MKKTKEKQEWKKCFLVVLVTFNEQLPLYISFLLILLVSVQNGCPLLSVRDLTQLGPHDQEELLPRLGDEVGRSVAPRGSA